jgi:hypothetical protein
VTARVPAAAVALALLGAGPALAADPYVPFPEKDPRERAVDTVRDLNDRLLPQGAPELGVEDLERGVLFLPRLDRGGRGGRGQVLPAHGASTPRAGDARALFERAGVDAPTDPSTLGGWWLLALAGLLAAAAAAFELRGGRLHQSP